MAAVLYNSNNNNDRQLGCCRVHKNSDVRRLCTGDGGAKVKVTAHKQQEATRSNTQHTIYKQQTHKTYQTTNAKPNTKANKDAINSHGNRFSTPLSCVWWPMP
jgi:hypothetical protein